MKKLFPFLMMVLMLGLAHSAIAQQSTSPKPSLNAIYNLELSADETVTDPITKVVTYNTNVSLTTGNLKLEKASKIVFDWKNRKLTIYDCKKFAFGGNCVVKDSPTKTNTIEYTLGDDTLYLL